MSHEEKAYQLFMGGCNCAQAVFTAFCDVTGMDEPTALKLSSSFGGGIGRMREVCGAVSAMAMVAGLVAGYSDGKDSNAKSEHYALVQRLAGQFREQNGTIICRELLALPAGASAPQSAPRDKAFYERRPCAELVKSAARILDEWLAQRT